MIGPVLAGAAALAVATATGALSGPILRRLREPAPADLPPGEHKTAYTDLAGPRFAFGAAVVAFALGVISWSVLEPARQPPWIVLASVGVLLALIDLRTTWLPLQLTRVGWAGMTLAVGLAALLTGDPWLLLHATVGAAGAAGIYSLAWALSRGGFGFGDVRFAPLIGAAAATVSWSAWIWALLLGTIAGALVGLVRLARHRIEPFPYAPSMLLGSYLAVAVSALVWT